MRRRPLRILALGTYPIRVPRHGGQRRCTALGLAHRRAGHHYAYACAYDPHAYSAEQVSGFDFPVDEPDWLGGGWAADVHAGSYSATNERAFDHFRSLARAMEANTFVLEHPFMWPLVRRLLEIPEFEGASVVYSSHNVEAPLKKKGLKTAGVPLKNIEKIVEATDVVERELVSYSDYIMGVSESDCAVYRSWRADVPVQLVPNGIDFASASASPRPDWAEGPYGLFVGSAHPPNKEGFSALVLGDGMQFLPRRKSLVVAGGVSDLIYHDAGYQARAASNGDRVQFFARPDDHELSALLHHAHVMLLPILAGGGTNLKTAEALVSGKWIIGSSNAFKGYEDFLGGTGIVIADTRAEFVGAIRTVLAAPPLVLPDHEREARKKVLWNSILDQYDLAQKLVQRQSGSTSGSPA